MSLTHLKPRRAPLAKLHWLCLGLLAISGTLQLLQGIPLSQNELVALRSAWGWADLALGTAPLPGDLQSIPHAAIPLWVQLPAAAALALGRWAGWGWHTLLAAARIAGFACSALLCTLALHIAPTGKKVLLVCCLLPGSVAMLTTANTLRPAFGLTLLYFAQALAICQCPVRLPAGRRLLLDITGLALVLAAPICLPLLLLVWLIPARRRTPRLPESTPAYKKVLVTLGRWLLCALVLAALVTAAALLLQQYGSQAADLRLDMLFSSSMVISSVQPGSVFSPGPTVVWQQVVLPLQWIKSLLWAFLLSAAALATPLTLRPTARQRWTALGSCAVCAAAWWLLAVLGMSTVSAQPLLLLLPVALWALTPVNIQLRREKPLALALGCLAATLLGHPTLFGIIGMM